MGTKVVCFDMDGTLITNTNSVKYLCSLSEKENALERIEAQEQNNEITWIEADYLKATLVKGLEVKKIKKHFKKNIKIINNLDNVLSVLKNKGFKRILITAGPLQVAKVLNDFYEFDAIFGSDYETNNGEFTGKIINHLGDHGKLKSLTHYCEKNNIDFTDVIAVGDSASDIKVFEKSGFSIAINYSDDLLGKADQYLRTNDLNKLLKFII